MDEWISDGPRITERDVLDRLRRVLEGEGPLIVEHRFYRGARAPHRFVCDSADELESYLAQSARPGDGFLFWSFEARCTTETAVTAGKVPDVEGRTPRGGAY